MDDKINSEINSEINSKVDQDLKRYIETAILPLYNNFEKAHNIGHIQNVINRSMDLAKNYDVNINMVYVIAAFHDLGHIFDRKKHHIISAKLLLDAVELKKWFNQNQLNIMKEAIEDHRGSLSKCPRSIYGKILSDADRSIDIDYSLRRAYNYDLKYFPDLTIEQHIDNCYKHMNEKYGKNGYLKLWLKSKKNMDAYNEHRKLAENKELYIQRFKEANNLL